MSATLENMQIKQEEIKNEFIATKEEMKTGKGEIKTSQKKRKRSNKE